ncbi:tyrosyl-tRNA synthetase [secondary endosymbiont of Heteropsylla cubana]|uniref:Tyrosine--tRNA ligase n=1 Tax=secondary endosymbiont of Heteropsylla cubana TaxID=134287 RepID=J3YT04_9ENTR|nr:tyrosine--tRNA ligase [secondary endosymbiont of Heteropsylla cubana]AFP85498.1 tyrosyl-tRNA synthetase [secondary endosymbiont of Heteropsylla cubana]
MATNNLIENLQNRNLIAQITDERTLAALLSTESISVYCGFDPSADSLHFGHLVPLLCLKRFQLAGHKPIILIGGATGLLGDPSFQATERKLHSVETVQEWVKHITCQVSRFLDFDCGNNSALVVNNYTWFSVIDILTFLRDVGKHFSINTMINKDLIKQRLTQANRGISFTEFSYNLLQGYDFAYLHKEYGATLQIGGSDQWGNIISGIDLTRRLYRNTVYAITVPLITRIDGSKLSKSSGNTIWLDPKKTSPYKFYQFLINTADKDVYRFLKFFTFLDLKIINELEQEDLSSNKSPKAQYVLAEEVTRIVHGEQGLATAKRITTSLFTGVLSNLTKDDFLQLELDGMPTSYITLGNNLQQVLVVTKLAPSLAQAKNLIISNAVSINDKKESSVNYLFNDTDRIYNQFTLLKRGKKHYHLIKWNLKK